MAVAFDAVGPGSSGTNTTGTALSWSHACAGSNRLLTAAVIVTTTVGNALSAVLTVTYNGVSMVSVGKKYSNGLDSGYVELFYLVAPATGTNTVAVTCTQSMMLIGGSVSFTGVDQLSPVSGATDNSGSDEFPGITVASRTGDMIVDAICAGSSIVSADQTQRWNANVNTLSAAGNGAQSTAAGAEAVTLGHNLSGADAWAMIAMNIKAVRLSNAPLVTSFSSAYNNPNPTKTLRVTTQPGDLLVVYGAGGDDVNTLSTPTGNGVTFTLKESVVVTDYSATYMWSGVDATGGTNWVLSCTAANNGDWGFSCLVFRGVTGAGASAKANSNTGTPLQNLTTTAAKSSLVVFVSDWNANDATGRSWRTVNGVTPSVSNGLELDYKFESGVYTTFGAYYNNVGQIGVKGIGLSAPSGQKWTLVALEVLAQPQTITGSPMLWLSPSHVQVTPLLFDDFSSGTHGSHWASQVGTISGGRLHLTTNANYSQSLITAQSYNLTNRSVSVQVPVVPSAPSGEASLEVGTAGNNVLIGKGGGALVLRLVVGGVPNDQYAGYDATKHLWWRIKLTGTYLEWQASPDSITWTTLRAATTGFPNLSAAFVQVLAGHYDAGDPDEPVDFDNIIVI